MTKLDIGKATAIRPPAPPQGAQIRIDAPDFVVYAELGDGVPTPTLDTGWETVGRPEDVSFTRWGGRDPDRETVPILLDGYRENRGVERDLKKIVRLAVRRDGGKPPKFRVRGPIHLAGELVVMEDLTFGDAIRRKDGTVLRQELTLALMADESPDRVKFKETKGGDGGEGNRNSYTVKKGESLLSIVTKFHPDASLKKRTDMARDVGEANGIRDIRKELNPGREIRLT